MKLLHLFTVGFGRPDLLIEQDRLLKKYLKDKFLLHLVDNTPGHDANVMRETADSLLIEYLRTDSGGVEHPDALNRGAQIAAEREYDFFMFLDHDVFPRRNCNVIKHLEKIGFYGIGQYHGPTNSAYLWPGLFGISRSWLDGRALDFNGIRGEQKRDDGDCGSMNARLFKDEDWVNLHGVLDHGYGFLRAPDAHGLQSFGYEQMGPWLHLSNSSHWMQIPEPEERDRLALELIRSI